MFGGIARVRYAAFGLCVRSDLARKRKARAVILQFYYIIKYDFITCIAYR